jgi:hypothetical protein
MKSFFKPLAEPDTLCPEIAKVMSEDEKIKTVVID